MSAVYENNPENNNDNKFDYDEYDLLCDNISNAINKRNFKTLQSLVTSYHDLRSCLYDACYHSKENDAIFLIENGASIFSEAASEIGYHGLMKVAVVLINKLKSDPPNTLYESSYNVFDKTAGDIIYDILINTFSYGFVELAKLCIQNGASQLDDVLVYAFRYNYDEVVECALAHGATHVNYDLLYACSTGNITNARKAIINGADMFGEAIEIACENEYIEIIKLLLPYQRNVDYVMDKLICHKKYNSIRVLLSRECVTINSAELSKKQIQDLLNHGCDLKFTGWNADKNIDIAKKVTHQRNIRQWCMFHAIDDISRIYIKDWEPKLISIINDYVAY